jgi:hypothetical protein
MQENIGRKWSKCKRCIVEIKLIYLNDRKIFLELSEIWREAKPTRRGNGTVVLSIGSHSIKFGFAADPLPKSIPSLIAYRRKATTKYILINKKFELLMLVMIYQSIHLYRERSVKESLKLSKKLKEN